METTKEIEELDFSDLLSFQTEKFHTKNDYSRVQLLFKDKLIGYLTLTKDDGEGKQLIAFDKEGYNFSHPIFNSIIEACYFLLKKAI